MIIYDNSLTWIKAIWGWFPLLTMIPGLGFSEGVIFYVLPNYMDEYKCSTHDFMDFPCGFVPLNFTSRVGQNDVGDALGRYGQLWAGHFRTLGTLELKILRKPQPCWISAWSLDRSLEKLPKRQVPQSFYVPNLSECELIRSLPSKSKSPTSEMIAAPASSYAWSIS